MPLTALCRIDMALTLIEGYIIAIIVGVIYCAKIIIIFHLGQTFSFFFAYYTHFGYNLSPVKYVNPNSLVTTAKIF